MARIRSFSVPRRGYDARVLPEQKLVRLTNDGYSYALVGDPDHKRFSSPSGKSAGQAIPTLQAEGWRIASVGVAGADGSAVVVLEKALGNDGFRT